MGNVVMWCGMVGGQVVAGGMVLRGRVGRTRGTVPGRMAGRQCVWWWKAGRCLVKGR